MNVPDVWSGDFSVSGFRIHFVPYNLRAMECSSLHVVFISGTCRATNVSELQTSFEPHRASTTLWDASHQERGSMKRSRSATTGCWGIAENGGQAVVTTIAQQLDAPLRR